jgi:hypothetical protein
VIRAEGLAPLADRGVVAQVAGQASSDATLRHERAGAQRRPFERLLLAHDPHRQPDVPEVGVEGERRHERPPAEPGDPLPDERHVLVEEVAE